MYWRTLGISILSISFFCYSSEQVSLINSIDQYKMFMALLSDQEIAWLYLLKEDVMGRTHLIEKHTREWDALQFDMLTRISNKVVDQRAGVIFQELVTRAILLRKQHMCEWSDFKQDFAKKAAILGDTQQQQIADFEQGNCM
jgi:hypothetical protein